ncbi:hypothetical protein NMD14_15260 [Aeromonas veronii]
MMLVVERHIRGVMQVNKSTRHSKITGDFAENLVLYWLSKYGFECTIVDHTGIDILAKNPHTNELMGISVKSRSRNAGKENHYLSIDNEHFNKVDVACRAFNCEPYLALVVDCKDDIKVFITSKDHLLSIHPKRQVCVGWKMSDDWITKYREDPKIMMIEFQYRTPRWWSPSS